jgi:anti-sigma factor RsiW
MKVTRDVIYDLLPGYFSGEISPDTRALVDEFLRQDPEFSKMMKRFRAVFREPRPQAGVAEAPRGVPAATGGEREVFERARANLRKSGELRGYIIAFTFAALFVIALLFERGTHGQARGWLIAGAFMLTALISWVQLYRLKVRGA